MKHRHSHKHIFSCPDVYLHLCENLDEQIDSESCRRIKAHIQECEHCSAMLDSLKKTVYLYRKYPTPKIPSKIKSELFAVIRLDKEKSKTTKER
jgi:hypothetical protein